MNHKKNLPFYLIALTIFIVLKVAYKYAHTQDLWFLLKPTNKLVAMMTGSTSVMIPDQGFYHASLHILIDKSCAGFNFWVLSFLLMVYVLLKYKEKPLFKILSIPLALLGSYFFTILVNTSRIFVSLILQNQTQHIFPQQQHILHEAIGVVNNLTFLILAYLLLDKLLIYTLRNAKIT